MEKKKPLFVDVSKKTSTVSNVTYLPESMYKAYDRAAFGRDLYVPIGWIENLDPEMAETFRNKSFEQTINKKPI